MTDLSREQIEWFRSKVMTYEDEYTRVLYGVCDMALRTRDAEAECERLREALMMARPFVKSWTGSRCNQAASEAAEVDKKIASALATPPPEGEYSIRCVICDASVRPEDGGLCDKHKYDEQAHGDALAALQWLEECAATQDSYRSGEAYTTIRKALTASGVRGHTITADDVMTWARTVMEDLESPGPVSTDEEARIARALCDPTSRASGVPKGDYHEGFEEGMRAGHGVPENNND